MCLTIAVLLVAVITAVVVAITEPPRTNAASIAAGTRHVASTTSRYICNDNSIHVRDSNISTFSPLSNYTIPANIT